MFLKHLKSFGFQFPSFHPDDDLGTITSPDGEVDDPVDDNKTDDDKTDDKVDEDEEIPENETEEEKATRLEAKKKGSEEDEPDDEETQRLTSYTDVKKKYPEFFKEFPDLKAALFRDERYSEILGSPEDAELAVEKASTLDKIEQDILINGDPSNILALVKKENPESFTKLAHSLLPLLQEMDKDLYYEIAAVPIKRVLRAAFAEGKGNTTDLGKAASYIHRFFFNDLNIEGAIPGETAYKKESKSRAQEDYEKRLQELDNKEYGQFKGSVDSSYVSSMTKTIREGLDKDDRLTEYTKSKLVEDILIDIRQQLDGDTRYGSQLNSLWKQAKSAGFTSDFKSRILNTALARAKSLVPSVRSKKVAEALKSKKAKDTTTTNRDTEVRRSSQRRETPRKESSKPLTDIDIMRS